KEEGDASQASRAASPAAQGVSQTPASAGAPLPSRSEELDFGLRRTRRRPKNTGDESCPDRRVGKGVRRTPCPPAERPHGAHASPCAPYDPPPRSRPSPSRRE